MKIVDIREIVVPIKSNIRNSYIDFSQMTVSVLALITDVMAMANLLSVTASILTADTRRAVSCEIALYRA